MCDHHKPWLKESDLATPECLYFGDLDDQCRNPESPHCLGRCPQKGRPPGETIEESRRGRLHLREQFMNGKKVASLERELEWEQAKSRLLLEMTRHIGKARAIGAGDMFEIVFLRPYEGNKMTGCRELRKLIEEVKYGPEAVFIAHSCCTVRPGYYLPASDSERREYVARVERQVKRKIGRLARLNQMNAGIYAGQLALEMQETQFPEQS